jgi:hypothetical protein
MDNQQYPSPGCTVWLILAAVLAPLALLAWGCSWWKRRGWSAAQSHLRAARAWMILARFPVDVVRPTIQDTRELWRKLDLLRPRPCGCRDRSVCGRAVALRKASPPHLARS